MTAIKHCPACGFDGVYLDGQFDRFTTLACSNCGHMMLERAVEPTKSDDYVVADDSALRRMLKTTRDKEFDLSVRLAQKHVPRGAWLDIGCSFGWFLEWIKRGDYDAYGVEPSPTAFHAASRAFSGKVLNGEFPSILEGAAGFPSQYSILSTMDVLEHIQDPAPFISAAREKLLPDGVLFLKVPSNDGVLFRLASMFSSRRNSEILGRLWQVDFNYPHWHYYSKRSIKSMLERQGFSVVAMRSMPFSFFSTAHDRVRNYDGAPESFISRAIKTILAYVLISASYVLQRFDNVIVLAKPIHSKQ